jgi:hypothetical protein
VILWKGGTFHFDHRLVLLSEGIADRKFFETLIQVKRLPKFDCPWPVLPEEEASTSAKSLHGIDKIGAMLSALNGIFHANPVLKEQILGVLVAVDAKDSAKGTFLSVKSQIATAGKFGVPDAENEVALANNRHPAISVISVPGDGQPGSLETLHVQALSVRFPSASKCMKTFLKCGTITVRNWNAEKQAKSELQCLVAATCRDDPSRAAGYLLSWRRKQKPVIAMTQGCFKPVYNAVRAFCKEVGAPMR